MGRWMFSPRWLLLHLGVLLAVAACGILGGWQLERANELHEASLTPERNSALSPVPLADLLTPGTLARDDVIGRRVQVTGTYDNAAQILVPDRTLDGVTGTVVLTPLVTGQGQAVIVQRGFVPGGPSTPAPAAPGGPVEITGWLAPSEAAPRANLDLPRGELGTVHLPSLANLVPHPLYDAYVGLLDETPPPANALAQEPAPEFTAAGQWPLQNVFYALEWWFFGLAAVAFWVATIRRGPAPD